MSFNVDDKLFDIDEVKLLPYSSILLFLENLNDLRFDLLTEIKNVEKFIEGSISYDLSEALELLEKLVSKLHYLDINLSIFKECLLIHENRIIQKTNFNKIPGKICLN